MNRLNIIHININGLRGRLTELNLLLDEVPADLLLLNETKLRDTEPPRIRGFKAAAYRNRQAGRTAGGGVAIYAADNLCCKDISPDLDDIAAVEVALGVNAKLAVISHYVPPPSNGPDATALAPFFAAYPACLIVGDLNSKHQFYGCRSTDRAGEELFNMVESNNLIVLIDPDQATYFDAKHSDILDYAIATEAVARMAKECTVGEDIGSDHLPLMIELQPNHRINRHEQVMYRPLGSCDWGKYTTLLDEKIEPTQDCSLLSQQAIDSRCEEVHQAITSALDSACPLRPVLKGVFRVSKATLLLISREIYEE